MDLDTSWSMRRGEGRCGARLHLSGHAVGLRARGITLHLWLHKEKGDAWHAQNMEEVRDGRGKTCEGW